MNDMEILNQIRKHKICAIVRGVPKEKIIAVADALYEGGIKAIEVTFNTTGASDMIRTLKSEYGNKILIGAGTVLDPETAKEAISAGASFILSPTLNLDVIKICLRYNVVPVPGITTATEALTAWENGARIVKLFPAGTLGTQYLKQIKGPLSQIDLMAVGAIGAENMKDFLDAGASSVGVGGELVNQSLIQADDFSEIKRRAETFSAIIGG